MTFLTSRSNPKLKQIRLLQQRKQRSASGLFVVEGIRHVGEACEAGAQLEYLCYAPDLLSSDYANNLIQEQSERGVPCLAVAEDVFASLAEKENPAGILAVVRQPNTRLTDLTPQNFTWGVALVAPQDPGNIGTILRTIDAVGASGLLLLDQAVDGYHPNAVRASMGALFWYPMVTSTFAEFLIWANRLEYVIYGTSARGGQDYRQVTHYQMPAILLMGSEREGLSPEQLTACSHTLRIPMRGRATSLNLAIATGVMLYDMLSKQ
ncbi:MAG: RNA methyltransferase [Anaerolineales bacterium]|nr:RNA methyltransferase [Anaerolineales bacterium]